jgi:hypothetical protein
VARLDERRKRPRRRFDERARADEHPSEMRHDDGMQPDDLEQLRLMLFPRLDREEGRRRIAAAFDGAADADRTRRIEELAADPDLVEEMFRRLSRERGNGLS